MYTFATEAGKQKLRAADGKIVSACLMRDLFGSILYLALQKKVDMIQLLTYLLTPIPMSLSNVDGSMLSTPKSKLMTYLESKAFSTTPDLINVQIIDAAFFLHLQKDLPATFAGVAKFLLKKLLQKEGKIIHFVSDKWIKPSIKDCERESRNSTDVSCYITGANQKRPTNWLLALRSCNFKTALLNFLVEAWANNDYAPLFQGKVLFANRGNTCYKFISILDKVVKTEESSLSCCHEEADSRIFFHASSVQSESNVVIRTSDTDCLVIALGCREKIDPSLKIWLEVGVQSRNDLRYISVDSIYSELGKGLCKALPAYHAFTGSDFTACFSRKGKVQPLKILEKDVKAQNAFSNLTNIDVSESIDVSEIEKFVCKMYGKKKFESINEVRAQIFMDKYKPKRDGDKISCAKKLEGSMMPPCQRVLLNKVKRTKFIANIWMSSTEASPPNTSPLAFGWKLVNGNYKLVWFEGDPSPSSLDIFTNVKIMMKVRFSSCFFFSSKI